MRFLVLRKRRILKKQKGEKLFLNDMEIQVAYVRWVGKKIRRLAEGFDRVVSLDFKEFFVKSNLLFQLAEKSYDKIAFRHGGVNRDVLEVQVDVLDDEYEKTLTKLALDARYVIVHTDIDREKFDFLCADAGVCPEFVQGDYRQNMVVVFGEEFLIKHLPSGKIYYDILPDAYFIPELNMIFSEYIRQNPHKVCDVKIRELMSK